jgi:hypothetical protein
MREGVGKYCPLGAPDCLVKCQWHMNGECAIKVIAKTMTEKPKVSKTTKSTYNSK